MHLVEFANHLFDQKDKSHVGPPPLNPLTTAVIGGHSLTAIQTFRAFGQKLADKKGKRFGQTVSFVGKRKKIANGGMLKFDIVRVRKYAEVSITKRNTFGDFRGKTGDLVKQIDPLTIRVRLSNGKEIDLTSEEFEFIPSKMPYEITAKSVVPIVKGFEHSDFHKNKKFAIDLFNEIDTDKSKTIDLNELKEAFAKAGKEESEEYW